MNATPDDRLIAFHAWRRRRALDAGLMKPEQVLDEWVFSRMLLQSPKDIYALEDLRLLTAPLFAQYGQDLLALCQGRPTEDERPRSQRREEPEPVHRAPPSRGTLVRAKRADPTPERGPVRRDSPQVSLHSTARQSSSEKRVIEDFIPGEGHGEWKGKDFEFGCSTAAFKYWETEFLEIWGALLAAVSEGNLAPASDDERAIAELTSRSRKATKEWEQAWVKVVLRRAYENT